MLSKEERKERNAAFWEGFRKEMRNIKSSNGKGINWINYPTGVNDVYVRLHTDSKITRLSFDIQPKDDGIRSILWEQMTELKIVMEESTGPADNWNEFDHVFAGRTVSRITWETSDYNFYQPEDWDDIKAFLRERLVAFDSFYQEFKEILILLAE